MITAYTTYVDQMKELQTKATKIVTTTNDTPTTKTVTTTNGSINPTNGNTRVYDNGPSGWTEYDSSGNAVRGGTSAGFTEGGETQATGLHLLHGNVGKPERVLSAEQTSSFNTLVSKLPDITSILKNIDVTKNHV